MKSVIKNLKKRRFLAGLSLTDRLDINSCGTHQSESFKYDTIQWYFTKNFNITTVHVTFTSLALGAKLYWIPLFRGVQLVETCLACSKKRKTVTSIDSLLDVLLYSLRVLSLTNSWLHNGNEGVQYVQSNIKCSKPFCHCHGILMKMTDCITSSLLLVPCISCAPFQPTKKFHVFFFQNKLASTGLITPLDLPAPTTFTLSHVLVNCHAELKSPGFHQAGHSLILLANSPI